MRAAVPLVVTTLVVLSTMGCGETPADKIASSPILVLDYISTEDVAKIYVHGASDHRYDALCIRIDDVEVLETNVISLSTNTTLNTFNLTACAVDGGHGYENMIEVEVLPQPGRAFRLVYSNGDVENVDMEDLPWKHRLDDI